MARVETFRDALLAVQTEYGLTEDYFDTTADEGEDRFYVGPKDSMPEGCPAFVIYKESGRVEEKTIHDSDEMWEWCRLPTTKRIHL